MGKLITVFWRDIPSHIIFKTKSGKFKKQMSPRFAEAIDRAAMRAGRHKERQIKIWQIQKSAQIEKKSSSVRTVLLLLLEKELIRQAESF